MRRGIYVWAHNHRAAPYVGGLRPFRAEDMGFFKPWRGVIR